MALFSFGASAEYNYKLSMKDCGEYASVASFQSSMFWMAVKEGKHKDSEMWKKTLAETATIYNVFCKD